MKQQVDNVVHSRSGITRRCNTTNKTTKVTNDIKQVTCFFCKPLPQRKANAQTT